MLYYYFLYQSLTFYWIFFCRLKKILLSSIIKLILKLEYGNLRNWIEIYLTWKFMERKLSINWITKRIKFRINIKT